MRSTIKTGKSTRTLGVIATVLLGVAACGESPTGVHDIPKPVSDTQQVCYVSDGVLYCVGVTTAKADTSGR